MKNLKVVFVLILIVVLFLAATLLFIKNRMQASETANLSQSLHEVENEVGRLVQENEKLQQDLEYAKGAAAKEKLEKDALQKKIDEIQKISSSLQTEVQAQPSGDKVSLLEAQIKELTTSYNRELGILYNKTKQYDKAIIALERILEANPNDIEAHLDMAIAYEKSKKDLDSAIFHYQKYLELNPDSKNKKEIERSIEKLKR